MFPDIEGTITIENEEATTMGKSFLFDFVSGDFVTVDGKLIQITGIDAVKVWIEKVLKTEKLKFPIYAEYGVNLLDFVNNDYPLEFIKIEIEREIEEALITNVEVMSAGNFVFTRENRILVCNFEVETIYGVTGGKLTI